jgi:Na+/proline symporter
MASDAMNAREFYSSAAQATTRASLIAALACLIGSALSPRAAAASFAQSPCMTQNAEEACASFARSLSHDINSVRALTYLH